jgi:hypothetical protein
MNVFNRLVMIVLLVVSMILLPVVLVLVTALPGTATTIGQQALSLLDVFEQNPLRSIIVGVSLAVLTFVICGLLLWLELHRPSQKVVRIHKVSGETAKMTTDSIARRLEYHIDQLAEVVSVKPKITARGKGVDVRLLVETAPEIDVPAKTEEISKVAREVIEEKMGLKLAGKIEIQIKHAPYSKDWAVMKKTPAPDKGPEEPVPLE